MFYSLTPYIIKFMKNKKWIFYLLIIVGFFVYLIFYKIGQVSFSGNSNISSAGNISTVQEKIETDKIIKINIIDGSTYGSLMATSGISYATTTAIYETAKPVYDLIKIRAGRLIELVFDKNSNELKELRYKIDSEDELFVKKQFAATSALAATNTQAVWQAEIKPIPYVIKTKTVQGTIESSLYQSALDNGIDIRAIIELANAFQWTIDFAMDPRVGDTYKFIFEERYLNGEYIMPGQILAGKYVNDNTPYEVYYFEEDEDNKGFFDNDGNSVQKMFLKAPVAFKYISSGFTTGHRYINAFKVFTSSHRAIDYAAALGTPIRAVGNGTITFAGWNSQGYGNYVSVHHNGTYSTNYAHLSKILVTRGQKVKQGDVIGKVGSTGFSTGPHLHFEMVKNGVKVNALKEVLPPGKPIKDENKERFFAEIEKWQKELNE